MTDNVSLMDAQHALETLATSDGVERFLKSQKTTEDNEGPQSTVEASKLIKGSIPILSKEIESYLKSASNGGRGKSPVAPKYLSQIDADKLAYITLSCVYSGTVKGNTVGAVQAHIGSTIETELVVKHLEEQRNRKVAARIQQQVSKQGNAKSRAKAFRKLVKDNLEADQQFEPLGQDLKVKLGEPLVNAVLVSMPDIFELHTQFEGRNNSNVYVRITDEAVQWLASLKEAAGWLQPVHAVPTAR